MTKEINKRITDVYPFLIPRNVWTDKISEDYNYEYIRGEREVPEGWNRLFLLFCKNLRPYLVEVGYLDKFRFSQIKEKYGSLQLYNFGIPEKARFLEYIYGRLSYYICCKCGKEATVESQGWICPWCDECKDECITHEPIEKQLIIKMERYSNGNTEILKYDSKPYWDEYLKCRQMSDEEFINYICDV